MSLRYRCAAQVLAPVVVVALSAGEVQLALPALEDSPAGVDEPAGLRIIGDGDQFSLRLMRDIGGQRQQLLALKGQRRDLRCTRSFLPMLLKAEEGISSTPAASMVFGHLLGRAFRTPPTARQNSR
jgi:hypothetical protein